MMKEKEIIKEVIRRIQIIFSTDRREDLFNEPSAVKDIIIQLAERSKRSFI